MADPLDLRRFPVHLGLGSTVVPQPEFTGIDWYEAYVDRTAADGGEGRLVSMYDFQTSWDSWEMHPHGDELVVCLSGKITLIQQRDDEPAHAIILSAGQYAINPTGTWHTADIAEPASALFITGGLGTRHRPR